MENYSHDDTAIPRTLGGSDLAATIIQLSNEAVKLNGMFQSVHVALTREESVDQSSAGLSNEWVDMRRAYTNILRSAKNIAARMHARTTEFTDVLTPVVADLTVSQDAKMAQLRAFVEADASRIITGEITGQVNMLKQQLGPFSEKHANLLKEKIDIARKKKIMLEQNQWVLT